MARDSKTVADWSRPLPRPLTIPKVMTLSTLTDVRALMRHLPKDHGDRPAWRHVAAEIERAAAGVDVIDVFVALRLALSIERVEYRMTGQA